MVALIVVKCVRLDNVVVESERMLVQKVLMLVCFVVVNSSTGQANRLPASRAAWSEHMSIFNVVMISNRNYLTHDISVRGMMIHVRGFHVAPCRLRDDLCSWLSCCTM